MITTILILIDDFSNTYACGKMNLVFGSFLERICANEANSFPEFPSPCKKINVEL